MTITRTDTVNKKCKITINNVNKEKIAEKLCNNFEEAMEFCKEHDKYFMIISKDSIDTFPEAPVKLEWIDN